MMGSDKRRLNILDYVILLLFSLLLAALVYFFINHGGMFRNDAYTVEYVLHIDCIDSALADNIRVGDDLRDAYTAFDIGTVTGVERNDCVMDIESPYTGEIVYNVLYPDHQSLDITVVGSAEKHAGLYSVGGLELSVGGTVSFRVPTLQAEGVCTSIEVYGE